MTVARMKTDYRVSISERLDLDATLVYFKKAQEVLDAAFKSTSY
jgi:hypothetical protein